MTFLCLCLFLFTTIFTFAQAPAGYYAAAEDKSGEALRTALHSIIKTHTTVSYSELWTSFQSTDIRPDNGKVWDMYSDRPGGTPAYYFTFVSDQCGNYSGEGDCYNREHSVPKSWFGGSVAPMYTDLFHLIPTDGFVNSKRGNLPIGKVTNATWTSTNGSKVGTSNISGYSGQVFEPIDSFKGDFARTYFYMATCYKDKNLGVETQSNFTGGDLKPWAKTLLLQWAAMDPVSQKEIDRNNAVWQIQHNRNPFIDYPELAEKIFGNDATPFTTSISVFADQHCWYVYPNPTTSTINIQSFDFQSDDMTVEIHDIAGRTLFSQQAKPSDNLQIDLSSFPAGLYLMTISSAQNIHTYKIVKQ
jgi:endonuclease I